MDAESIEWKLTANLRNGPTFFQPLADSIEPLQFKLIGSDTVATAFPVFDTKYIPDSLINYLFKLFNLEIESGKTYPQLHSLTKQEFLNYWFHSFAVVVLQTDEKFIQDNQDWHSVLLGTFYIKPNYAPRCSHNCNAGFLVNGAHRGQKVGYRLAQVYLNWAPLLGYKYSIFNLVFVTNQASWKIWDKLNFQRIGLVPHAGILNGFSEPVDAIIYGKDLTKIEPEFLSME
ncbi:BAH_G0028460.mRNA.1.CDS.1 [Saccharomyces cerevisiae]|nr:SX2_G0049510.mRNA.1.CDS.1 [Saccharomyces cerevisiae]CAI4412592.1 BAM_G0013680.mRNA.1.CDS.1 [Saccharomyces cerevisiae]CAI4420678.1 BAH_G0028460.mRNA.1.CDS.1 [Saccharomyces cerevisiae]CAI4430969.1 BAK_1a_G0016230.mRNA.1.CDS.1 [Saccharomyces cerevisiae]CAI4440247.1 BAQ_1a_G0016500.mRNA.1.CDS.1 [Saccharomyces cerevisiae]